MQTPSRVMAVLLRRAALPSLAMAALVTTGCTQSPPAGAEPVPRAGHTTGLSTDAGSRPQSSAMGSLGTAAKPTCAQPFPDVDALCACLDGPEGARTCAVSQPAHPLGTSRLSMVTWGTLPGEQTYSLVARDGASVRLVAHLGAAFEPGAFGIHGEVEVDGGEVRELGGRRVVVVRSEQRAADLNAAGLETCFEDTRFETVCALGEGSRPTRCVSVPTSTRRGCEQGVEAPDDAMDDQRRALLAELEEHWSTSRAELGWSLTGDGAVEVRVTRGMPEGVAARAIGRHPLF